MRVHREASDGRGGGGKGLQRSTYSASWCDTKRSSVHRECEAVWYEDALNVEKWGIRGGYHHGKQRKE